MLACGEKGNRFATPNAEIMIHQMEAGIQGSAIDMQLQAKRVIRLQENLVDMLAGWTVHDYHHIEPISPRSHDIFR
jgi:ATP-dependent Clp protease protease subunit